MKRRFFYVVVEFEKLNALLQTLVQVVVESNASNISAWVKVIVPLAYNKNNMPKKTTYEFIKPPFYINSIYSTICEKFRNMLKLTYFPTFNTIKLFLIRR